jgi:type IV secretion system protein VirB1
MPVDLPACAPHVAPLTMARVIEVESGGNPLALHVNRVARQPPRAENAVQAAAIARSYIAAGYSVDLGLAQINSRNLSVLGYTVEEALDPCQNLSGGAHILRAFYLRAAQEMGAGQPALLASLSAYNTGNFRNGFQNGYVAKYSQAPALRLVSSGAPLSMHPTQAPTAPSRPRPTNPYSADPRLTSWDETPQAWTR